MIKKFFNKIKLTFKLFFLGLKAGDDAIFGTSTNSSDIKSILEKQFGGGVFNDLLENKVTQEVEELRDKHYRVFKESDKFDTSTITVNIDDEGEIVGFNAPRLSKKNLNDFMRHPPVYNPENFTIITIQDNKHIQNHSSISDSSIPNGIYDYATTLTLHRDNFIPRFEIEKFVKKIVVRKPDNEEGRAIVDLYLPNEASQFGKIDAILISNLATMFETKNYKSDITDLTGIEWVSDKAWGVCDISLFSFKDVILSNIDIFDGNFVLVYDCKIENNGLYIPEKYKTETLDMKYKSNAKKSDIFELQ